jgi:hypothetical protein
LKDHLFRGPSDHLIIPFLFRQTAISFSPVMPGDRQSRVFRDDRRNRRPAPASASVPARCSQLAINPGATMAAPRA